MKLRIIPSSNRLVDIRLSLGSRELFSFPPHAAAPGERKVFRADFGSSTKVRRKPNPMDSNASPKKRRRISFNCPRVGLGEERIHSEISKTRTKHFNVIVLGFFLVKSHLSLESSDLFGKRLGTLARARRSKECSLRDHVWNCEQRMRHI